MIDFNISTDNIHIYNSYQIETREDMTYWLEYIKKYINDFNIDCYVFDCRTDNSLIEEWRAHNLLYNLHLFRSHTKDVDLNCESKFRQFIYKILSMLYCK